MNYFKIIIWLAGALIVCQSPALAGSMKYDAVKIYPKSGQPMVIKNFEVPWYKKVKGRWNNTRIEIPLRNIKSIKFLGIYDDYDAELEVELTMRDGKKSILRIEDGCCPCKGETQFGEIKIDLEEMKFLDFYPDLSKPDTPIQAPAPTAPQGKEINPGQ